MRAGGSMKGGMLVRCGRQGRERDLPLDTFSMRNFDERPVFAPCTAIRGAIAPHCPPPIEGAGGGRGSGRAVGVARLLAWKNVFSDTSGQGRGCSTPLPVSPSPRGRYPIDTLPGRNTTSLPSTRSPSPKSRLCPLALYPDYRHALPAPSEGGREEAAAAAGRWGWLDC